MVNWFDFVHYCIIYLFIFKVQRYNFYFSYTSIYFANAFTHSKRFTHLHIQAITHSKDLHIHAITHSKDLHIHAITHSKDLHIQAITHSKDLHIQTISVLGDSI